MNIFHVSEWIVQYVALGTRKRRDFWNICLGPCDIDNLAHPLVTVRLFALLIILIKWICRCFSCFQSIVNFFFSSYYFFCSLAADI